MKKKIAPSKPDQPGIFRRWSLAKIHAGKAASEHREANASGPGTDAQDRPDLPEIADLKRLFKRPEFSTRDGLDDYDGDYTKFENLGNILTHEMKRFLARSLKEQESTPPETPGQRSPDTRNNQIAQSPSPKEDTEPAGDS